MGLPSSTEPPAFKSGSSVLRAESVDSTQSRSVDPRPPWTDLSAATGGGGGVGDNGCPYTRTSGCTVAHGHRVGFRVVPSGRDFWLGTDDLALSPDGIPSRQAPVAAPGSCREAE